ncbi:MAG: hypothetical protein MI923_16325 [Phycisphaerales bacterium]|nr:hypothetical protein [Phycisphaerales bacterium]
MSKDERKKHNQALFEDHVRPSTLKMEVYANLRQMEQRLRAYRLKQKEMLIQRQVSLYNFARFWAELTGKKASARQLPTLFTLKRFSWWIPKKYREEALGDIIEDASNMHEAGLSKWQIRRRVLVQMCWLLVSRFKLWRIGAVAWLLERGREMLFRG